MSLNKNYYVIAGYDLTDCETYKYYDWKWTEEGENFLCYQRKGEIQLFDNAIHNNHLYLGFVLASGDEYEFNTDKFDLQDLIDVEKYVKAELDNLISLGVVSDNPKLKPKYEVIVFEECN